MRPLVLSMQAFGPFIEKQTIDFTRIQPGLFLISGQTGSGKTTIFDALSFALFGQASGEIRQPKNFRSDFADSDLPTEVYLKFSHNNREYEIRRSPSYERPKLRGEGLTTQAARAELVFSDGRKPIDRPSEVDQAIVELLGVDYDNFRQTSMLAQGEFSKLLRADSDHRATIFREIFQTQHIQLFQEQLKQKAKAKRDELTIQWAKYDQAVSYLEFTLDDLLVAQNKFAEDLHNQIRPQIDPAGWIIAQSQADQAALATNQAKQKRVKAALEEKRKQIDAGKKWLDKEKAWEQLSLDLQAREEAAKDFPNRKERLKLAHDVLYKLKPLADLYTSKKTELELASKVKEELTRKQAELEDLYKKHQATYEELAKEEDQRKNQDQEIRSLESTLPTYQKLSQALSQKDQLQGTLKDLEEIIQKTRDQAAELTTQIEIKKSLTRVLSDLLRQEAEQVKNLDQSKESLQKISNSILWLENFSRKEIAKDQHKTKVDQAFTALRAKVKHKNQLEAAYMTQEAALLALSLEKGEPCPVCGSHEHPSPAQARGEEVSKEHLNQAKSEHAEAETYYQKLRTEYTDRLVNLEHKWSEQKTLSATNQELLPYEDMNQLAPEPKTNYFAKLISESKKQELVAQDLVNKETQTLTEIKSKLQASQQAEGELETLSEDLLKLQALLKEREEQAGQVKQDISALEATIKTRREGLVHENLVEAEQALASLKGAYNTWVKDLGSAKEKAEQTKEQLNQAQEELSRSSGRLESLNTEFTKRQTSFVQGLEDLGLADEKAFYDYLLTPEELEAKDNKLKSDEEALRELRMRANNFLEDWDKDQEQPDLKSLADEFQELSKQSEHLLSEANNIENRIDKNDKTGQRLADQTQVLQKLESNYRDLIEITDIANGSRKGGLKRDFENYVQSYYFRQILNMANSRLSTMTGGRYQLLPQTEVVDKRKAAGLDISVLDLNTGKERPLSTLSGGESFMTALALALGLSDVAQAYQGGLVIETLFIDEGFGSLDRASLSEAVRVLEEVGASRYHCGIISHVEELQDEIDQQIRVVKEAQGSRLEFIKV